MKVLLEDEKVKETEIKIGDIFYDHNLKLTYMLQNLQFEEYPFATVNLNGISRWQTYMSFESAVASLKKDIEKGFLRHFKQSEWQLELKRK